MVSTRYRATISTNRVPGSAPSPEMFDWLVVMSSTHHLHTNSEFPSCICILYCRWERSFVTHPNVFQSTKWFFFPRIQITQGISFSPPWTNRKNFTRSSCFQIKHTDAHTRHCARSAEDSWRNTHGKYPCQAQGNRICSHFSKRLWQTLVKINTCCRGVDHGKRGALPTLSTRRTCLIPRPGFNCDTGSFRLTATTLSICFCPGLIICIKRHCGRNQFQADCLLSWWQLSVWENYRYNVACTDLGWGLVTHGFDTAQTYGILVSIWSDPLMYYHPWRREIDRKHRWTMRLRTMPRGQTGSQWCLSWNSGRYWHSLEPMSRNTPTSATSPQLVFTSLGLSSSMSPSAWLHFWKAASHGPACLLVADKHVCKVGHEAFLVFREFRSQHPKSVNKNDTKRPTYFTVRTTVC